MGHLVDPCTAAGRDARKIVIGTILATDMSWHFEWLERFGRAVKERVSGKAEAPLVANVRGDGWTLSRQEVEVESLDPAETDREDKLFLCQALMKCADISNPVCYPLLRIDPY